MSEFLAELSLSRTFTFRIILTLLRCEKAIRLLHFVFEFPPFGEIVFSLTNLERLNNLLFCPLLFVFLLKSFFYSVVKDQNTLCHVFLVGLDGLEPSTSRLSGARSSHLSYRPLSYSRALIRITFCLLGFVRLPLTSHRAMSVGLLLTSPISAAGTAGWWR